jgi:serine/threonine-protein kinase
VTAERWARISYLFRAALEKAVGERAAFLESACGSDAALRSDIERLLAGEAEPSLPSPLAEFLEGSATEFAPGEMLAHYRVEAKSGEGGMGAVYSAYDVRLHRKVALKILPPHALADPDRMGRLMREARAASALNHPNIVTIYEVGSDRGVDFIAMELVSGKTLARLISRKGLPLRDALKHAVQIASALAAAHRAGIVHRDLKPANIMVNDAGQVKVLDFGLAKQTERAAGEDTGSTHAMGPETDTGIVLGTVAYMSPEQAEGKKLDARSDIFSFGVVLYEMVTGKRAFERDSTAATLAAILKEEPKPPGELASGLPPDLEKVMTRCLRKDPARRFQHMEDLEVALEELKEASDSGALETAVAARPKRFRKLPWAAGLPLLLAAAVAGVWMVRFGAPWRTARPVERPLVRLDVDLGPEVALPPIATNTHNLILSPDGTRLVYVAGSPTRLYTRRLDQSKTNELPGTEGAGRPFFSPDGQWVGFFTGNSGKNLNKISVEGGGVVPLADVGDNARGASWGAEGSIIVGQLFAKGLMRVPANGGPPTTVVEVAPGEADYVYPQILPGGKAVLFVAGGLTASIEVFSFADRRRKTLVGWGNSGRYLRSGHLVYNKQGTLFAIPFDVDRLETRGTAVPILDDVAYSENGLTDVDASWTGTMVYRRGSGSGASGMWTLQWVDGTGRKEPLLPKPGAYSGFSLSPDGKRIALVVYEMGRQDMWIYDSKRDAMMRLTFEGGAYYPPPIWSPDGRYIVFGSPNGIYWTRTDGSGQPRRLTSSKNTQAPWSFTPDGKRLAYNENMGTPQIWTVPLEDRGGQLTAGKPEQFLESRFSDVQPVFSPNGRWLAYVSDESGEFEVYVREFMPTAFGHSGKWQVCNSGGNNPMWSRTKRELVYQAGDQLMAVSYSIMDTFVAEKPRVWIDKLGGTIDLAPDGKRVAVMTPVDTPEAPKASHEVTFLFNFFDELRRRAPSSE